MNRQRLPRFRDPAAVPGGIRRLQIIDRINETPEPAEVLAVKVDREPRQVNDIRVLPLRFQSAGRSDSSPG